MRGAVSAGVLLGLLVVVVGISIGLSRLPPSSSVTITPRPSPLGAATGSPGASPRVTDLGSSPAGTASPPAGSAPTAGTAPSGPASRAPGPGNVGLGVGEQAPPLTVEALDGGTIDLAGLAGRPVWVNFMATYCPSCQEELPLMQRMSAAFGDRLAIVVVDIREDRATVEPYMEALGIALPVGLDLDGRAQRDWGTFALPVHYWVDADGVIRSFLFGSAPPDAFLEGVRAVLPDASFEP